MVKKFTCSFCGFDIEPGTGMIYVKNDGSLLYLCSSKCRKNAVLLRRRARKLKWTNLYEERVRRQKAAAKTRSSKSKSRSKRARRSKAKSSTSS